MGRPYVAIDPAIGGYGAADIYLGEFSPQLPVPVAAIVASARSLGCQCDTEMPTGRTLTET